MTDLGYEPDHIRAWLSGPGESPALDRMADVMMTAMAVVGEDDLDLALKVLSKVQAMVVARMLRGAKPSEVEDILLRVGPGVQDEAIRFLRALRRDIKDARN